MGDFSLMLEIYFNDDSTSQLEDESMEMGVVEDIGMLKTPFTQCKVEDFDNLSSFE